MRKFVYIIYSVFVILSANSCDELGKLTNKVPVIKNITADPDTVEIGGTVYLSVEVTEPDNDVFSVSWSANDGTFSYGIGTTVQWIAPQAEGIFTIVVTVTDVNEGEAIDEVNIVTVSDKDPDVKITVPADGDYVVGHGFLEIVAEVTPSTSIDRVEFYIDDILVHTDTRSPYSFSLDLSDRIGLVRIKCIAYRTSNPVIKGSDEIEINIQAIVPIPL